MNNWFGTQYFPFHNRDSEDAERIWKDWEIMTFQHCKIRRSISEIILKVYIYIYYVIMEEVDLMYNLHRYSIHLQYQNERSVPPVPLNNALIPPPGERRRDSAGAAPPRPPPLTPGPGSP